MGNPGSIYLVDNILISAPATRVRITWVRYSNGNISVSEAFKTKINYLFSSTGFEASYVFIFFSFF